MELFAILRAEKINQGAETAAHNHNLRVCKTKKESNVDYSKSHKNELLLGNRNTIGIINKKVAQRKNKKKLRADANRVIEFVLSASPEYFYDFNKVGMTRDEWDNLIPSKFEGKMNIYWKRINEVKATLKEDKLNQWKKDSLEWVKKEFGDNVVNLVLHMDEKTPHMHLLAVPLTKEGNLTAKEFYTPEIAKRWQNDYAEATNLKHGISSDKKHQELKEQYFKTGYQEGYKKGIEDTKKIGVQVGALADGIKGSWHKPTAKAIAQAEAIKKQANAYANKTLTQAEKLVQDERSRRRQLEAELEKKSNIATNLEAENKRLKRELEGYRSTPSNNKSNKPHL